MSDQRIAIIGFMGSGKTTVAQELARLLNCNWIDLDERIRKHDRRSPREIIEQAGEAEFRRVETRLLRKELKTGSARVIALGGGAWTIVVNQQRLRDHGVFTVWLDTPFDICWKRIEAIKEERPLARNRGMAHKLYEKRRPIYSSADLQIVVDESQGVAQIAEQIIAEVLQEQKNI